MANPNAAFGLRPVRSLGRMNTQVNEYIHDSGDGTGLFIGDPVKTNGTSSTGVAGIPDGTAIVTATGTITTTAIRGAVVGVRPTYTNLTLQYCPGSVNLGILVSDDPGQIYEIQSNGTFVIGDVGCTVGVTTGSGSTNTGISAYAMTESDVGQSSHVLHIIRLAPIAGNALGAYAVVEVNVNVHENGQGTGAAGT